MLGRTDSGRRLLLLLIVFVVAAGALVVRLGYWQLVKHDELVESARRQIYYRAEVPSRRGQIYDRSGTIVLASSVTRDRLIVSAENMDDAERAAMVEFLTAQLALDAAASGALAAKLVEPQAVPGPRPRPPARAVRRRSRRPPRRPASPASPSSPMPSRSYPQAGGGPHSTLAAHLLGFVNRDGEGQYGVEQFYQDVLAGRAPRRRGRPGLERRAARRDRADGRAGRARRGHPADHRCRPAARDRAGGHVGGHRERRDSPSRRSCWTRGPARSTPRRPSRRTTRTTTRRSPPRTSRVFVDPVVSHVYEPGSVFKMMTVVAGLEQGTTAAGQGLPGQRPDVARRRRVADHGRRQPGDGQHAARGRHRVLAQHRRRQGRPGPRADDAQGLDDPPRGLDAPRASGGRPASTSPARFAGSSTTRRSRAGARSTSRTARSARASRSPSSSSRRRTRRWSTAACSSSPTSSPAIGAEPVVATQDAPVLDPTLSAPLVGAAGARPQEPVVRGGVAGPGLLGRRQDGHRAGLGRGAQALVLQHLQLLVRRVHRARRGPSRPRRRRQDRRGAAEPERARPVLPAGDVDGAVPARGDRRDRHARAAAGPGPRGRTVAALVEQ